MNGGYVERRDDGYAATGTRVSLDSIVYAFVSGESAESIAQAFPVLSLEQGYGAITFYLAHRDEIGEMARSLEVFRAGEMERRRLAERERADQLTQRERTAAIDGIIGRFRAAIRAIIGTVADRELSSGSTVCTAMYHAKRLTVTLTVAASRANRAIRSR